jgi:hypothetical protein
MLHDRSRFLTSRKYSALIRVYLRLGVVVASVLVLAGCGGSNDEGRTPAAAPPTTSNTTSSTTEQFAGATMGPVVATTSAKDTALLERVAVGSHEGYDRVVFQFRGDLPGYRVEYVERPLKEDGSGNPVEIQGNGIVMVRMEPASGFDLNTGEGEMVYKGPKRLEGSDSGSAVIRELVRTGDFEAVLSWAVGLDSRVPFRVTTATSPARLIVDFRAS